MGIREFEDFVAVSRTRFRCDLELSDTRMCRFTHAMREMFNECCSEFEEQTLMENLREEFQNYMETLAKGA